MDIKKIDSVTFDVRDLRRSAKFYADVLGLSEIWRMDEARMAGFGVGDNSATINLQEKPSGSGSELSIQVESVDDARRALEQKGVRFDGDTFEIPDIGKGARFKDPDANRLMLLDYSIEHARDPGPTQPPSSARDDDPGAGAGRSRGSPGEAAAG